MPTISTLSAPPPYRSLSAASSPTFGSAATAAAGRAVNINLPPIGAYAAGIGLVSMVFKTVMDPVLDELRHTSRNRTGAFEVLTAKKIEKLGFDDIIGHEKTKHDLKAFLTRALHPELQAYFHPNEAFNAKSSMLLTGQPGTGKNMMVQALASQLEGGSLIKVNCNTLVQDGTGSGPKNVYRLEKATKQALKNGPVLLFMNELDALGNRVELGKMGDNESRKTLSRILTLWDELNADPLKQAKKKPADTKPKQEGGKPGKTDSKKPDRPSKKPKTKHPVLLVGATNQPGMVDEALRNRFQQVVEVAPPTHLELKDMFNHYLKRTDIRFAEPIDLERLAGLAQGFTGRKVQAAIATLEQRVSDREITRILALPKAEREQALKAFEKKSDTPKYTSSQAELEEAVRDVQDHHKKQFDLIG